MKKLLLTLGAVASVAAPVAAVVACGDKIPTTAGGDIMNPTLQSTKTLDELKAFTLGSKDTASTLKIALGLPQTPMAATGAVYTWDKDNLKLTMKSNANGVKMTQVITVTPKAATTLTKDQKIAKIGADAVAKINAVDDAASDKLAQVNDIIAEFIAAEGDGTAFKQKNQHKEFKFGTDNKLTWTQVDTNGPIEYDNVQAFEGRNPAEDNSYETAQNLLLNAAQTKLLNR